MECSLDLQEQSFGLERLKQKEFWEIPLRIG